MGRRDDGGDEENAGDSFPKINIVPEGMTYEQYVETLDISFAEISARENFLDAVASGTDPDLAGIEVGWTPRKTRQVMADKDFAELVSLAQNALDLRISRVVAKKALGGHEWAVKLWLFNRRPDLFKDVRHIEVKHGVEVPAHVIAATRDAVRDGVLAAIGAGRLQELQPPADVEDIMDAEVISDELTD
jgi:hypothetical protein